MKVLGIAVSIVILFVSLAFAQMTPPDTPLALTYSVLHEEEETIGGVRFYDSDIQLDIPLEAVVKLTPQQIKDTAVAAVWKVYKKSGHNIIGVKVFYDKHNDTDNLIGFAQLSSGSEHVETGWETKVYPVPPLLEMQIHTLWFDLKPQYMVQGCYGMEVDKDVLLTVIAEELQVPVELVEVPTGERGLCRDLRQ